MSAPGMHFDDIVDRHAADYDLLFDEDPFEVMCRDIAALIAKVEELRTLGDALETNLRIHANSGIRDTDSALDEWEHERLGRTMNGRPR